MGIRDFFKSSSEKTINDLSIPANRQINLNPGRKSLEWMDEVELYEGTYADIRQENGWELVKGWEFRRSADRFLPVRYALKNIIIEAKFDSDAGVVTEKILENL
jgi:hypothetical protein